MTTIAAILVVLALLAHLTAVVLHDGHGHRPVSRVPRSHHPDPFEPRWLL